MLSVSRLAGKIKTALDNQSNDSTKNPAQARQDTANELAQGIIDEIKQLKITYGAGLSTPAGGGAVVGTWTITLS
jgi:hypothetical protein